MQEVRYLFSKMEYAKGLLSEIFMVVVITQLLQCTLFRITQIVLLNSVLVLVLKGSRKILVNVPSQDLWLKFHIRVMMSELRMVCPSRSHIFEICSALFYHAATRMLNIGCFIFEFLSNIFIYFWNGKRMNNGYLLEKFLWLIRQGRIKEVVVEFGKWKNGFHRLSR